MAIPRFLKELAAGLFESLTSKSTSRKSSEPRNGHGGQGRRAAERRDDGVGKPAARGGRAEADGQGGKRKQDSAATGRAAADPRHAGRGRRAEAARSSGETLVAHSPSELPGVGDAPKVYSVPDLGLPEFDYSPREDDFPDPGEVVWTWVPYEEDRSQGKDRPVLVLAEIERCIVFAQLTSKDHDRDAEQEARNGRFWIDVGSGGWDSKGRPSEARIDRLLCVAPEQMRREGGSLDEARFTQVVAAIRRFHR